jgi:hypothetical protein
MSLCNPGVESTCSADSLTGNVTVNNGPRFSVIASSVPVLICNAFCDWLLAHRRRVNYPEHSYFIAAFSSYCR